MSKWTDGDIALLAADMSTREQSIASKATAFGPPALVSVYVCTLSILHSIPIVVHGGYGLHFTFEMNRGDICGYRLGLIRSIGLRR